MQAIKRFVLAVMSGFAGVGVLALMGLPFAAFTGLPLWTAPALGLGIVLLASKC